MFEGEPEPDNSRELDSVLVEAPIPHNISVASNYDSAAQNESNTCSQDELRVLCGRMTDLRLDDSRHALRIATVLVGIDAWIYDDESNIIYYSSTLMYKLSLIGITDIESLCAVIMCCNL